MKSKIKSKQKSSQSFSQKVIEKAHKINLDTIKLLISRDDFQKIVKNIRKELDISANGLKDSERKKWWDDFDIKSDKVISSKPFIQKYKKIIEKQKRKEFKSRSELMKALKELDDTVPINKLNKMVMGIITSLGIPIHFHRHIQDYILYNTITAPTLNYVIQKDFIKKEITLKPFTILRKDELKLAKQEMNNVLRDAENAKYKHLKGFNYGFTNVVLKPYRNIDRDIKIIEKSKNKGLQQTEEFLEDKETWEYNDREIAGEIWDDKSTKYTIGKQRLIIRQARHRVKRASKTRFKA